MREKELDHDLRFLVRWEYAAGEWCWVAWALLHAFPEGDPANVVATRLGATPGAALADLLAVPKVRDWPAAEYDHHAHYAELRRTGAIPPLNAKP